MFLIALGLAGAAGVMYLINKNSGPSVSRQAIAPAPTPVAVAATPVELVEEVVTAEDPIEWEEQAEEEVADAPLEEDLEIDQEQLMAAAEAEVREQEAAEAAAAQEAAQEPTQVPEDEWPWPEEVVEEPPVQLPGTGVVTSPIRNPLSQLATKKPKPKKPAPKPATPPASAVKPKRAFGLKLRGPKVLDANNSVAEVPGLRNQSDSVPGLLRALLDVLAPYGGNADRVAAVMSKRSGFNPAFKGNVTETGKTGYGLMAWSHPVSQTATEQVLNDLSHTIQTHPWLAQDPALIVLQPYMDSGVIKQGAFAGRSDSVVVVEQPYVDISAHAPTQAELMWPRLGHWDKNGDGIVTLGDIRSSFYNLLNGVGRVQA